MMVNVKVFTFLANFNRKPLNLILENDEMNHLFLNILLWLKALVLLSVQESNYTSLIEF